MINITTSPKISKYSFCTIQAVHVPLDACIRKMDRELDFFITHNGLSVSPGERPDPFQVRHCEAWLRIFARPRKSINFDISSYGLKHLVEVWPFEGEVWPGDGYCSNGSLIEAALNLGFKFIPIGNERSPNACFNIRLNRNRNRREREYERVCGREVYLPFDDEMGGTK